MEAQRRSSSRSIKRKKFDDELVDSSPTNKKVKAQPSKATPGNTQSLVAEVSLSPLKHEVIKRRTARSAKKTRKGRGQVTGKGVGRWKPADDLALILGVNKTNDLVACYLGIKFSCKFTLNEIQDRWHALLYDSTVSKVSIGAIRNLHPMIRDEVMNCTLFSDEEEKLLCEIKPQPQLPLNKFAELIQSHPLVFGVHRTAEQLCHHWQKLGEYHLLKDQIVEPVPRADQPILSFSDTEEYMEDSELLELMDEKVEQEISHCNRIKQRKIKQLEEEVVRWEQKLSALHGTPSPYFDNGTLAVFKGRNIKYIMRSKEITFGRSTPDHKVDLDLSLAGPAMKISRRQGVVRFTDTGKFYLLSEGKRPIFVDGHPVMKNERRVICNNALIDVAGFTFIFLTNPDLINAIQLRAAKLNS